MIFSFDNDNNIISYFLLKLNANLPIIFYMACFTTHDRRIFDLADNLEIINAWRPNALSVSGIIKYDNNKVIFRSFTIAILGMFQ